MPQRLGSHEHPPQSDREQLTSTAESAGPKLWLVPTIDKAVELVEKRLQAEADHASAETADALFLVRFVQEAYADLQELAWNRHVADDSALEEFSGGRVPQQPWSKFMQDRVFELAGESDPGNDDSSKLELVCLCLALLFFHSCRFRDDLEGTRFALRLFETFLGSGHRAGDFPTYDVMSFYVSCVSYEQFLLGEDNGEACPTADRARRVVDRNRGVGAPTQADETVMSAIARIADVGRGAALDPSRGRGRGQEEQLDGLMRFGLELAQESYDRGLRYIPAQSSAPTHTWLGQYDDAVIAGIDAVRHSSMRPLGFRMPEVMKLRSIVAEINRNAMEKRLEGRAAELESQLDERLEMLARELDVRANAATQRAIVPAVEVLGIFVAVLAVAASTVGGSFVGGLEFAERLQIIGLGAACALVVLAMVGVLVGRWHPFAWIKRNRQSQASIVDSA